MFNPLNYNPGYAGNKAVLSAALVYRNQWVGIDGSPKTVTFASHSPLKNKNMGVGFEITSDKIGPQNNLWVQGSYAYRFRVSKISKGKIGLGLKAGLFNTSYNWSKINFKDQDDIQIGSNTTSRTVPVFDFGIYYHQTNKHFLGAAIKNLNNPNIDQTNNLSAQRSNQFSHLVFTGGVIVEFNDRVVFRPSFLAQSSLATGTKPLADINMSLLFDQIFWVGLSYRTSNTIATILEYEITSMFKVGYSYDYTLGELSRYSSGSHEIFIGFNYNVFKSRMRSPRYYF